MQNILSPPGARGSHIKLMFLESNISSIFSSSSSDA